MHQVEEIKLNKESKQDKDKRIAEPIKDLDGIRRIRSILGNKPRDLLLLNLALETGMGMKNILQMRVKDLTGINKGEKIPIKYDGSQKHPFIMTALLYETFQTYLKQVEPKPEDYLFKSKKSPKPLNLSTVSNMIKNWFNAAEIKNCHGAISLRKTWEYNQQRDSYSDKVINIPKHLSIFKPIETPTAQQTVFNKLFNAIVSSKIPPGTRITTDEISKAFKVSQAPVRVALNWLEARGFITSQRKRGSLVKELTIGELHEIVQIRLILETAAAELSYKVCTEETLNLLESLIERYKSAYNFEESDQLNRLFHQTLYRDANMPLLIRLITDLYDRFSPYAAFAFANIGRMPKQDPHQEIPEYYHIKILEGMRRKNLGKILKNIKKDLERAMSFTEEVLKKRQGMSTSDLERQVQ